MDDKPVYCIQGNCIDRALTAGCNGKGWTEGVCYTLNTIDRPAGVYALASTSSNNTNNRICYNQQRFGKYGCENIGSTLKSRNDFQDLVVENQKYGTGVTHRWLKIITSCVA